MIRILSIEDAHRLKPTEKAILTLFMQDHNLKEIAVKLSMTESAVGKTMARLRIEFNVKSNAGLVMFLHNGKLI
jgi:DNA-binding CsgD family transcriptional regulator